MQRRVRVYTGWDGGELPVGPGGGGDTVISPNKLAKSRRVGIIGMVIFPRTQMQPPLFGDTVNFSRPSFTLRSLVLRPIPE